MEKLKNIRKCPCVSQVAVARNHLIAHPNCETLLKIDNMSIRDDFPSLTLSDLKNLLIEVENVAKSALGISQEKFMFEGWKGVSELFDKLRILQQ